LDWRPAGVAAGVPSSFMKEYGMVFRCTPHRVATLLAVAGCLLVHHGCTYFQHRGEDALDMLELGVTVSEKPSFSAYFCVVSLANFGGGYVDGHVLGIGGGRAGWIRHYQKSIGLILWTYEELGWGDEFDIEDAETLDCHHFGVMGWLAYPERRPAYAPACMKSLHLGYGGMVANVRFLEIVDFLLGWYGLDLCGDDGTQYGHWPWQTEDARNVPYRPELPW